MAGVLSAFASCKNTFSVYIGGFQSQFTVKKFKNEIHSGTKIVYVYYDIDVHDNTLPLYKKILLGAHYNRQSKKLYLGMCWYQSPEDRSLVLVLSLSRTKCVEPRFDVITWKKGDEKAVWQTNLMSVLRDYVPRIDIPVNRSHAMILLVEAIKPNLWDEALGSNLDETGSKMYDVPLWRTGYTPGQYTYNNQLLAEPKSTGKRKAATKAAQKLSQQAVATSKKKKREPKPRQAKKQAKVELDDEIMEIDSSPPTQVSQRPPDPIIKNSNNATSNSVDRRDEEINTYKKQVEELSSMVKKLIEKISENLLRLQPHSR